MTGRPSDFMPEYVEQAHKLCRLGATDAEVADFFGCNRRTLQRWQHDHPELAEAMKLGKEIPDSRVERALYARAVGYDFEAVKIFCNKDGIVTEVPYLEHVPPDPKAAMQWLFNRRPNEWRLRVEHTGKEGGPIQLTFGSLTRETFDKL